MRTNRTYMPITSIFLYYSLVPFPHNDSRDGGGVDPECSGRNASCRILPSVTGYGILAKLRMRRRSLTGRFAAAVVRFRL
jgi:hypothetical protein